MVRRHCGGGPLLNQTSKKTESLRLMRRRVPADLPITRNSLALFRLGEQCNNKCPMCSNSGRPEAFFQPIPELLRRADFLHNAGIRNVILTGGEPTIHPGFWLVIERLRQHGIQWDINTHGRTFSGAEFTDRCVQAGLGRAIVSLHSHIEADSCLISGMSARGHAEVLGGIDQLLATTVAVSVNCVLTELMQGNLASYIEFCLARWGVGYTVKLVFPSTAGKGGDWQHIQLRLRDVQADLQQAIEIAEFRGLKLAFESLPSCIVGDASMDNMGRGGFGETHYLDDITGDRLYPIRHIEAQFNVFPESCQGCAAIGRCSGVAEVYLRRYGAAELRRFR